MRTGVGTAATIADGMGNLSHGPAKLHDTDVVHLLREAGAIVIGKTNLPEMTIWPFAESPTFGATRNP